MFGYLNLKLDVSLIMFRNDDTHKVFLNDSVVLKKTVMLTFFYYLKRVEIVSNYEQAKKICDFQPPTCYRKKTN